MLYLDRRIRVHTSNVDNKLYLILSGRRYNGFYYYESMIIFHEECMYLGNYMEKIREE